MRREKVKYYDITDLFIDYTAWHNTAPLVNVWPEVSYLEDGTTVKVISAADFWDYMIEHFATFLFFDPIAIIMKRMHDDYNVDNARNQLFYKWRDWIDQHPEFVRLAQMMNRTDYDPLENYDRKEDGGWHDTTDDDAVHSMAYAEVSTTTENDPKIKTKTTGKVYPDDGGTAMNDTESITEPVRDSATDVDTITTTTPEHTDTSSVEGDLVVTREFDDYHVHGNIGVTTAAQMIEGEINVRTKKNIMVMMLEAFAREHFTLSGRRQEVNWIDD